MLSESSARHAIAALGVETFEVPQQQQAKIPTRRQTRPANVVCVEPLTERLNVSVEARCVEDLIQSCVERMRGAPRQVLRGHPHRGLLRTTPSWAHRHARQCSTRDRSCRSLTQSFTNGC